ncbi:MAG TPA: hypothetical protein GXZ89_06450 [Fastidiosipila sp.]|nr:hypothetical protein [Fastidiosipila sp.]
MAKAKTTKRTVAKPKKSGPSAWQRFRRTKPGRVLIVVFVYAALLSLFAWISGKNISRFLLLTGILFTISMIFAWLLYMTLRDKGESTTKTRKARSR